MISAVVYSASSREHYDDLAAARDAPGTTWVRASGASAEEMERVADVFGIHHLTIEDVRNDIRPKTEEFAAHTFVLVKTVQLRRGETTFEEELRTEPVGVVVGRDWLVTLSRHEVDAVEQVWANVEAGHERLCASGPDFAAYRIVDRIVDDYFGVLDEVEKIIEEIEDSILGETDSGVIEQLNTVRRDLLSVRKVLWPTREAAGVLARGDPDQVRESTEKYYRDVYDHLVQLVDLTETYRDLARGARDIYLNTLSQSTNEVMKRLTVVATIILPLTLVVGIFGMNFADSPWNMPELAWPFGYPAVMIGMAVVSLVLLVYFREERWL